MIDKYRESDSRTPGKTKDATLTLLKRELGRVKLAGLQPARVHALVPRSTFLLVRRCAQVRTRCAPGTQVRTAHFPRPATGIRD